MEQTIFLILLAVVMLIGSFLAGSIPLVVNLSEEKLQLVSILGAGMLVGTALTVIIPEGCRALFSTAQDHITKSVEVSVKTSPQGQEHLHELVGMALLLGFLFMLFIDQLSHSRMKDVESGVKGGDQGITATIGLVVHSAADGVALGAAASTSHHDVEIIVFLAIMLHKAPAAFGLVTFLLHEGLERNRIRKHLLIFSIAAPLLSLITYFGLGQESKDTLSLVNAAGTVLLFSAGTFLYVSTVHVLPELTLKNHSSNTNSHSVGGLKKQELFAIVVGALLPSILTIGHHH